MLSKSKMSANRLEALEEPWKETNELRRSFLRPTTVTWIPSAISLSAIAFPMPDVAPTRRTCLYGKDILEPIDREIYYPRSAFSDIGASAVSYWKLEDLESFI
jgi:hypothetical protein